LQLIREFFIVSYDFEVNPSIWRYYETKAFKKLMKIYDGMTNIILSYVEKAIKDIESKPPQEGREESILEKLLKINKKVAVVMCADAMLAGVDTTSSAAIGILYCLAKNQDKQELLREELKMLLPDRNEALTPEKMRNMPYLRAVIKEGMRLYPPAIGNLRRSDEDMVLCGYQVPKGTEVAMGQMLSYTDEKQFPQPSKFIPERWIKTNIDPQCPHAKDSAHAFAFLPFGFGSRMCVGRRFAELEMEVLITKIIQNYKIEWNYEDLKIKGVLVNVPDGDLKFKFTEV
jgi:cytochrome P450 family 12